MLLFFQLLPLGFTERQSLKKHRGTELKRFGQEGYHEKRARVSLYQCKTTSGCRPCAQSNHLPARMWRFIVAFPPVGRLVGGRESCSKRLCHVFTFLCCPSAVSNRRRWAPRTSEWEQGGETRTGHLRGGGTKTTSWPPEAPSIWLLDRIRLVKLAGPRFWRLSLECLFFLPT